MDWNSKSFAYSVLVFVTFRKEGVDWNPPTIADIRKRCGHLPQGRCGLKCTITTTTVNTARSSPSARKVWIEITCAYCHSRQQKSPSARKVWIEIWKRDANRTGRMSPSARKVWIEITIVRRRKDVKIVTFRKEGVDWNKNLSLVSRSFLGHLPQGRCGLKCDSIVLSHPGIMSPSARKVWIEIMYLYPYS